jgi:site-specific DNA-methyltransferase (adenine-specific)
VLPQRDHLGLRLRRQAKAPLAAKHDTILVYVRDPARYLFDAEAVEREPYMAPGLVGPEKAARGKRPTDTWWHTIVPTNGPSAPATRRRSPRACCAGSSPPPRAPGGWCLDFFAGSGTLGAVCSKLGRRYVLVDCNPQAIAVMAARLG